jgi:antirestriction protein ArdC
VRDLLDQLSEQVAALSDLETWTRFLVAQARFHQYSHSNTLLILAQCPTARSVAGFNSWRHLGRSVRRGERAIWIVAPMLRRTNSTGESAIELHGFRRVGVFDISQTEGPALVEICRPLQGEDVHGHFSHLVEIAERIGFSVARAEMAIGLFGDCTYRTRQIRVSTSASPMQGVKTLVHEIAHALMHEFCDDRALAELEAESVAYVVCQHLGLETSAYSLGYVATWAGGTDLAVERIRRSCQRITGAARSIIDLLPDEVDCAAPSLDAPFRSGVDLLVR